MIEKSGQKRTPDKCSITNQNCQTPTNLPPIEFPREAQEMILYLGKSKQQLCFDVLLQKASKLFFYIGALSICSETVFYPALQPAHALVNTGFRTSARLRRRQLYLNIKKKSVTRRRKNVSPVYGLFTTGIR